MKGRSIMRKFFLSIFVAVLAGVVSSVSAAPSVLSLGTEEDVTGPDGRLPYIAADSKNQPHIVMDVGGSGLVYYYDKVGSTWAFSSFNPGGSQFYNPHIEINDGDQAWISGAMWWPQGMGVIVRNNMATAPTHVAYTGTKAGTSSLPISNLSLDPETYNESVVYAGNGGYWEIIKWTGTAFASGGKGSLWTGSGGEKNYFWISRADSFLHADGQNHPVWHSCSDWSYNNSVRRAAGKGPVNWADYGSYPYMGDDGCYPLVLSDNEEPQTAYLFTDYGSYGGPGVCLQVWHSSDSQGDGAFVFNPAGGLLVVDPAGGSGARRFEPQGYPANGGGVWLCWQAGSNVRIRYAPSDIRSTADLGELIEFPGYRPAMCVDNEGNLHVVYSNGGVKYRKIMISGDGASVPSAGVAGDYDGDGADDLAVYGKTTGDWFIRKVDLDRTGVQEGFNWGDSSTFPICGNYDEDAEDEVVVYQLATGAWFIRDLDPQNEGIVEYWGGDGFIPVVGDYDGDEVNDLALYEQATGYWFIRTVDGKLLLWALNWGVPGMIPVAGDYDGDGVSDLCVFDPVTGRWYIRSMSGKLLYFGGEWGAGLTPVSGDYDGDGVWDLAVYDSASGNFYIRSIKRNPTAPPVYFGAVWKGEEGINATPVSGDFNEDGASDIALYHPEDGAWFIRDIHSGEDIFNSYNDGLYGGPDYYPLMGHFGEFGPAEMALYSSGGWFVRTVSDAGKPILFKGNWGHSTMDPLAGDFDGDGTNDLIVYQSSSGYWFIRDLDITKPALMFANEVIGGPGWVPFVGTFDTDNLDDIGAYEIETGTWKIRYSGSGIITTITDWGQSGRVPVVADYDNDGIDDLGLYDITEGAWYAKPARQDGELIVDGLVWGLGADGAIPLAGDYGGVDTTADLAIYWPANGQWFIRNIADMPPTGGDPYPPIAFGLQTGSPNGHPIRGDFDGDGVLDPAAYDPHTGRWYIHNVSSTIQWGGGEDHAIIGHR